MFIALSCPFRADVSVSTIETNSVKYIPCLEASSFLAGQEILSNMWIPFSRGPAGILMQMD
jgi:hypothetical protein